jgi:hypothetical protein
MLASPPVLLEFIIAVRILTITIHLMYVPLSVHSAYSLQEGIATPAELV